MNELIILGVMLSIFFVAFLIYAIVEIVYAKLFLHSKKSIWEIVNEI